MHLSVYCNHDEVLHFRHYYIVLTAYVGKSLTYCSDWYGRLFNLKVILDLLFDVLLFNVITVDSDNENITVLIFICIKH